MSLYDFLISIIKGKAKPEGATWTQPSGRRVTKINGKIVPVKTGRKKKKLQPIKIGRKKKIDPEKEKKIKEKEEKKQSILALTGDRYYTFFKKYLDIVKKRFGIGRSEVIRKNIVEEHKKYEETGEKVSFERFHISYLEYYKNKEKWDKYFSERENKPKPEFQKFVGEKKPKKEGERKKRKKKPYDKKILKYLYELNKPKNVTYKQGEPISLDRETRFKEYVAYNGKKFATGREHLTQLPTKNYISEEMQTKGNLAPHQKDSVNLALEKFEKGEKGFLLADGTGAGKTRQAIALAQSYLEAINANKPVIIVTESESILQTAWKEDLEAMGIPWNNAKLNGFKPGMINITTYSQADKIKDYPDKGLIIMDEAHNAKNSDSNTYAAMKQVMEEADHTFMATATPMDKLEQMQYICDALGMDFQKVYKTIKDVDPYKEAMNIDSLFEDITRQGLMVKREVPFGDLDVKLIKTKFSPANQKKLEKALEEVRKTGNKSQYVNVRRLLEEFKVEQAIDDVVKDIEAGKQVVLFADRVSDAKILGFDSPGTLPLLEKKLKERGIPFESIYGGASTEFDKQEIKRKKDAFQSGKVKVILGNPESMGTGISLDDTTGKNPRTLRILSTPYSANDAIQMLGRINRLTTIGKSEAFFYSSDNPIDDWNVEILKNKFLTLGALVGGDYANFDLEGKGVMFKPGTKPPPPFTMEQFKKIKKELEEIANSAIAEGEVQKAKFIWNLLKILKARAVKYYKRTGTKGNYKYYYTREEWEKARNKEKKTHKINKKHPEITHGQLERLEKERANTIEAIKNTPTSRSIGLRSKLAALNKKINAIKNESTPSLFQNNGRGEAKPMAKEPPQPINRVSEPKENTDIVQKPSETTNIPKRVEFNGKSGTIVKEKIVNGKKYYSIRFDNGKFLPSIPESKVSNIPEPENKQEKPQEKPVEKEPTVTRGVEKPQETVQTVTPQAKEPTIESKPEEEVKEEVNNKIDKPKNSVDEPKIVNPKYYPNENQFNRIQSGDSDSLIRFASKLWMESGAPSGLANAINQGRLNQDDLQDAISEAYIFAWKKHQAGEFKNATPATLTSYLNRLLHYKINEEARVANKHVYDTDMLQKIEVEYGISPEDEYIQKEDMSKKVER
jgi:hypothetical protein